jgi:hypothetical protein
MRDELSHVGSVRARLLPATMKFFSQMGRTGVLVIAYQYVTSYLRLAETYARWQDRWLGRV